MGEKEQKVKGKLTMTHKMLILVLTVWVFSLIFAAIAWLIKDKFPAEFINAVNTVAVPTIISYSVKSGFEFKTRLDKKGNFTAEKIK